MRTIKLLAVCSVVMLFCGCGNGKDVTGTLTVSSPTITQLPAFVQASFSVSYTNPYVSSVGGVEVGVTTSSPTIAGAGTSTTYTLQDNGTGAATIVLTYLLPRDTVIDQTFALSASTGDLHASAVAVVPVQGAVVPVTSPMSAIPSSLTFISTAPVNSTQTAIISGGTGSYSVLNINPSPNPNISASISGNILTVTKTSLVTGGIATILVIDSASPPNSTSVTVNY